MDIYDQHEQSERVRSWLKDNMSAIITGVVVGLGLIFGYQQWENHKVRQAHTAAELYQGAVRAAADPGAAQAVREQLRNDYPRSGFAVLAALEQAQAQATAGDLDGARTSLAWVRDQARDGALKSLATLRLAQIELAAGEAETALRLVDGVPAQDYPGIRHELRGDALLALGQADEAHAAYLDARPAGPADPSRLEMKLAEFPADEAGDA